MVVERGGRIEKRQKKGVNRMSSIIRGPGPCPPPPPPLKHRAPGWWQREVIGGSGVKLIIDHSHSASNRVCICACVW